MPLSGRPSVPGSGLEDPGAEHTASYFAHALLGGDASAASAYFAPGARLLTPDGTAVSGRPAITGVLAQLTSSNQKLEIKIGRTLQTEAVALATQYWKRTSNATKVEPFERLTTATLVLRREGERWQILIAAPWG